MFSVNLLRSAHRIKILPIGAAILLAGIMLGIAQRTALAHERVEVGPYVVVLGWVKEPVIVGERNALLIEVSLDGEPVEDLEGSITLTVFYGGRSFIGLLAPSEKPGLYTTEIFPTLRGQYEVNLVGQIGDETVDMILEPEEVLPANVLQFPEAQPAPSEMQAEIETLQSDLQKANTTALIGVGIGGISLILAGVALFLARKKT